MSNLNDFFEKRKVANLTRMGYEKNLDKLKKTPEDYENEKKEKKFFDFFSFKKKGS